MVEVRNELGAMLIECYGMSEVRDGTVVCDEWQLARNDPDRCDSVPGIIFYGYDTVRNGYTAYWSRVMRSPNTDEFNLYVNRERLLETFATTPTIFIFAVVHGPCKWNLLGVVRREQPDLLDHTCEGSSSVCTSNYKFR